MGHNLIIFVFIILNGYIFYFMRRQRKKFTGEIKVEIVSVFKFLKDLGLEEKGTKKLKENISKGFEGSSQLQPLWEKFESSLVALNPIDKEPILATTESECFINIENLLERSDFTVSFPIWNAVPQILTSIGIIGTFASILLSLWNLGDTNSITEKFILDLVNSLATGFVSSLIGVSLASIFSFYEKNDTKVVTKLLADLNWWLDMAFPTLTSEKLLVDQSHILSNLASDISTSISNGFSTMTGSLGPALADIIDDETKKTIKDGVASSFLEMNNILIDIRDESKKLKEELLELRTSKQQVLDTVKSLTEEQNKIQSEINVQSVNLAENLKSFEKIITPLSEVARQVQATNELSDKLIGSVLSVTEASKNIQNSIMLAENIGKETSAKFADQVKNIKDEYGGLVTSIEGWVNNSNTSLQNNLGEFDKNIGSVLRQVLTISNSLNTSVNSLERVVKKTELEVPKADSLVDEN